MPNFCFPCLARLQVQCAHLHRSFRGGFHYSAGEVWDDLTEVCDDCGADLDVPSLFLDFHLPISQELQPCAI